MAQLKSLVLCSALVAFLVAGTVASIVAVLLTVGMPSTTTTTTTTTTITTSNSAPIRQITRAGDPISGFYGTVTGGPTGTVDNWYSTPAESTEKAIDGNVTPKFLNEGAPGSATYQAGVNSGFYVTPTVSNASIAWGIQFATGNDQPERDPLVISLEGTNSSALNSSVWTLLYVGSTGIDLVNTPNRSTYMAMQLFSNTVPCQSYRLIVLAKRSGSSSVQYAEANIWGYY